MRAPARLYLIVAAALALILAWGAAEKGPTRWDDSWYLAAAVRLFDRFAEEGLAGYWRGFEHALGDKAPLITVLPFPFFCLLGRSTYVIYLVNSAACVVLSLALYRLARKWLAEKAALLAVFFALSSPLLLGLSRIFLVEYWLAALTVCALWALAEWEEKRKWRWLLALGAFCGLGLLMKITFPLFAGPVVAVVLLRTCRRRVLSLAGALLLLALPAAALAGRWYAHNWTLVTRRSLQESYFVPAHDVVRASPAAMAADYFFMLLNDGLSAAHLAAAAVGLLWWLARGRDNFLRGGWWYLVPWVAALPVFVLSENRDLRLIAPLIPAAAIVLGALAARLGRPVIALLAALGCLIAFEGSFARLGIPTIRLGRWQVFRSTTSYAFPPNPHYWPLDEVIERLARRDRLGPGSRLIVGLGADTWSFNSNNLDLHAALRRQPIEFHTTAYTSDPELVRRIMSRTQYFLWKEGGTQQPMTRFQGGAITRDYLLHGPLFREVEFGIETPDGGRLRLFENASLGPDMFVSRRQSGVLPELAPVNLNFGDQLQLTGLRFTEQEGVFRLALRWRCLNPAAGPYRAFAHLVDREGKLAGTMDHEILRGAPPVESWQPGDEGYEARYLVLPASQAPGTTLRLGLFHPETRLRVPVWASTFPLKDDYTAAVVEPNQEPGREYQFRLGPAPIQSCDVRFERGVRLTGYSLRRGARTAWLRLQWLIPSGEQSRLYFFGHAVASQDRETAILLGFDQDLGLDRRPRPPRGGSFLLLQDVVRDVSQLGPEVKFLRAGLFDMDEPLDRLAVRSSSLPMSREQKAIFLPY
jgi:hypothetical protein